MSFTLPSHPPHSGILRDHPHSHFPWKFLSCQDTPGSPSSCQGYLVLAAGAPGSRTGTGWSLWRAASSPLPPLCLRAPGKDSGFRERSRRFQRLAWNQRPGQRDGIRAKSSTRGKTGNILAEFFLQGRVGLWLQRGRDEILGFH